MWRVMFFLAGGICIGLALLVWRMADHTAKRTLDVWAAPQAEAFAALTDRPDLLRFRLAASPEVLNAVVWGPSGRVLHPAPDDFNQLSYELTDAELRAYETLRDAGPGWSAAPLGREAVVRCQNTPDICLLLDPAAVFDATGIDVTDLLRRRPGLAELALALIGAGFLGLALLVRPQIHPQARPQAPALPRTEPHNTGTELVLFPEHLRAARGPLEIDLTQRDIAILTYLKDKNGAVATKDELYDAAWGRDFMPNSRALDQHIITLRRKLDPDRSRPAVIETVRGVGYRMPG